MEDNNNAAAIPQSEQPAAPAPAPARAAESTGSKVLTMGIIMAAIALALFWVKQDRASSAARPAGAASGPSAVKPGAVAPALILKDLDGKTVNLEDLRGKVVIVDFWATWCQPCQIMIPWLVEFRNRYASQGFEIVGVAMDDEGIEAVKPFVTRNKMNYPILLGNEGAATDWGGVYGLPTSFMIDRSGKIRITHQGLVSKDIIERDIRSLL